MRAELFDRATISKLDWPETTDGDYARRYLTPMMVDWPEKYIRNVHNTRMTVARAGSLVLPITATDFHPDNTYTVSPYTHYISYATSEEVHRLKNPAVESIIKLALLPVAAYLRRSGFDRVALVNNWLVSTNLYPAMERAALDAVLDCLPEWFPDRPIVFRSVDTMRGGLLLEALQSRGYELVFSRQIWYQRPAQSVRLRQFREDVRETRRNGHRITAELGPDEISRALELYELLYLKKYSYYNPQFTAEFLRLAHADGLLNIRTARRGTELNGVLGYFVRNGAMTCPLFGYDTSLPQDLGLYRMLSVAVMQEGLAAGLLVHASGGVGKFKKLRGGTAAIEYNAVYTGHLPRSRRVPWKLIKPIANATIPVIQRNEF